MRVLTFCIFFSLASTILIGQSGLLENGTLFKIKVARAGVHKITGKWLQDNFNIAAGTINTDDIQLLGIKSGPLQHASDWADTQRLEPISIFIDDAGDGILHEDDYILFYGEGPDSWEYDGKWSYIKNPYAIKNSYILKILSDQTISRIQEVSSTPPESLSTTYTYKYIYHKDIFNLLGADLSTQGSGQRWFGEELTNIGEVDLASNLQIPAEGLENVLLSSAFAGRSKTSEKLNLRVGDEINTPAWSPVNTGDVEELYARIFEPQINLLKLSPIDPIALRYDKNSDEAKLWLDWLQVTGDAALRYENEQLIFNNLLSISENTNGLSISNSDGKSIWNITAPLHPASVVPIKDINAAVINSGNELEEYIVFDATNDVLTPTGAGPIKNSKIERAVDADMIVVYPSVLATQAERFVDHRSQFSDISVNAIAIEDIYNEYAAGRPDVTALRNYVRHIYRQGGRLKYLLLFGDGSYDFRGLDPGLPFDNLIPTFETFESLDPLFAFPSDDYFGLLDDGENGNLIGDLDIAVGRFTISTIAEASAVVNKVISYDTNKETQGAWKTNIAFLADDEDRNLHINDADRIAEEVGATYPLFNQEKIYFDAFPQASTPGGNRYPEATDKLNNTVANGALIINYLGHGGPRGWSQERVLKVDDITSWTNSLKLPLIVTATCSFTGFDDPAVNTAGEAVLLNPVGGAIALFTTVRSVFASKNFLLTQSVFRQMFKREQGEYLSIGEIMQLGKNTLLNDNLNGRKFFLIGDPSLKLAIPSNTIETTSINGRAINADQVIDTLGALDESVIAGHVLTPFGEVATDFNGLIDITVFDKSSEVSTLGNDESSFVRTFNAQNNFIYKGRAKVTEGAFEISWRVPIDINYSYGLAKFSYYAVSENGQEAVGHGEQIAIVGSSDEPPIDNEGPIVDIFINDRTFVNGATVGQNNVAIVDLSDASGINLSTAGIGHEITSRLNEKISIVNEHYIPSIDSPNEGMLIIPLENLEDGPYTLTLTAFDVLNNPGQSTINFEVASGILAKTNSIDIFPNPVSQQGEISVEISTDSRITQAEVSIDVFDIQGRLVSTQSDLITNTNGRILAPVKIDTQESGTYVLKIRLTDLKGGLISEEAIKKVVRLK